MQQGSNTVANPKGTPNVRSANSARDNNLSCSIAWIVFTSAEGDAWTSLTNRLAQLDLAQSACVRERIIVRQVSNVDTPSTTSCPALAHWKVVCASSWQDAQRKALEHTKSDRLLLVDSDRVSSMADTDLVSGYLQRTAWVQVRPVGVQGSWCRKGKQWLLQRCAWLTTGCGTRYSLSPMVGVPRSAWHKATQQATREFPGDHPLASIESCVLLRNLGITPWEIPARTGESLSRQSLLRILWTTIVWLLLILRMAWNRSWFPVHDREGATLQPRESRVSWILAAMVLLSAIPFFFGNLGFPLVEPDEARNVQIALEMEASGDYVLPTHHGEPYLDKPAMLFWLMSSSMEWFGRSEWSARLPLACAGWLTVASIVLVGSRRFGLYASSIGGILLMTCIGFALVTRFVITDSILTCCMTWAALSLHRGSAPRAWRNVWWLIAGIALGLGALTKGPVAPVLVLPPFIAWLWLEKQLNWRALAASLWIAIPMIVIPLPWFISVALREPQQLEYFFWKHNVVRFAQAFNHQQPFWFYLPVILAGMFPTSMLIPSLIVSLLSRRPRLRRMRTSNEGFLWLSALTTIGFFSISSAKLPTYILPALPLMSLLIGRFVARILLSHQAQRGQLHQVYHRHLARWLPLQASFVVAIIAIGAAITERQLVSNIQINDWIIGSIIIASLIGFGITIRWMRGAFIGRWATLGLSVPLVIGFVFLDVYPDGVAYRSYFPEALTELAQWEAQRLPNAAMDESGEVNSSPRSSLVSLANQNSPLQPKSDLPVVWFGRLADSTQLRREVAPEFQFSEEQVRELCSFVLHAQELGHSETIVMAIPRHVELIEKRMPFGFEVTQVNPEGLMWSMKVRPLNSLPVRSELAEIDSSTSTR